MTHPQNPQEAVDNVRAEMAAVTGVRFRSGDAVVISRGGTHSGFKDPLNGHGGIVQRMSPDGRWVLVEMKPGGLCSLPPGNLRLIGETP